MASKRKNSDASKRRRGGAERTGFRRSLWLTARRPLLGIAGWAAFAAVSAAVLRLLDARVHAQLVERNGPRLEFVDVPPAIHDLVVEDLGRRLTPLLHARDWTADGLCASLADEASRCGWVRTLRSVRRRCDGAFVIAAQYHEPFAMVDVSDGYALVDRDGVRLPGTYFFHRTWKLIQGVRDPAPPSGSRWTGADLSAALSLLDRLRREPFEDQITGVLVGNYGGRESPGASHIELSTDRAGGRIRWGSAPGSELVENSVEEKIAILRANFRNAGRADAGHAIIDISTFKDGFVVPGSPPLAP